jgi:hypothetical protein
MTPRKSTWLIEIGDGFREATVEAASLAWDWSNENFRGMWMGSMSEENFKKAVGNVLIADEVKITLDEPFREPKKVETKE